MDDNIESDAQRVVLGRYDLWPVLVCEYEQGGKCGKAATAALVGYEDFTPLCQEHHDAIAAIVARLKR